MDLVFVDKVLTNLTNCNNYYVAFKQNGLVHDYFTPEECVALKNLDDVIEISGELINFGNKTRIFNRFQKELRNFRSDDGFWLEFSEMIMKVHPNS